MLCLIYYEAPADPQANIDLTRQWSSAFGRAQAKAYPVGLACGVVIGWLASALYSRRPSRDHLVSYPENRGKMFGTAPITRAELIVPAIVALIGAATAVALGVFVLPRLSDSELLRIKPVGWVTVAAALQGLVVSLPVLAFSIKISAKRGWLRRE